MIAFASTGHPVTARLIVRRVKDARHRDGLFPVWRYHPFRDVPVRGVSSGGVSVLM